jgi:cytochrome c oxidase subunit 3
MSSGATAEAGLSEAERETATAEGQPGSATGAESVAPQGPASATSAAVDEQRTMLPPPGEAPGGLVRKGPTGEKEREPRSPPEKARIFFGIYFTLTGLHGIHVIAGIFVIGWIFIRSWQGRYSREYYTPVDMVGLYWHLVDLVWIFLFPLLYLIH